jgi:hypothetical protein
MSLRIRTIASRSLEPSPSAAPSPAPMMNSSLGKEAEGEEKNKDIPIFPPSVDCSPPLHHPSTGGPIDSHHVGGRTVRTGKEGRWKSPK